MASLLKDCGFEDIKVIGRGQYGKAHLVRSEKDQGFYIAKTIELTCLSKKEHETAMQEVDLLRSLDHPNIVEYKDNFLVTDTLIIIMQYCEGGDLQTYIKEKNKEKQRIREVQIMNYFVQILQALQYIHHDKRILHRDLKTSNLFLMKSKQVVKLGDFGISRVLEGSIEAAITVVGTPYYMSPEVCENKPYTFKSDVWSLGCVLYELCMLKHAFSADNLLGLVYKIVSDKYEPIPKMYSGNLNVLIQRMLEKDADKRPSVRELLADPNVHSFMNDYVRTKGQCATASGHGHGHGGGAHGAAKAGAGGGHARGPASGGSAPGAAPSASGPRGSGTRSPGQEALPSPGGDHSASGSRPPRPRPPKREERSSPNSTMLRSTPSGAAAGPAAGRPGMPTRKEAPKHETPKEAALRRKREAADRQAAELKAAARQAEQDRVMARQMKETQFHSTRAGPSAMTSAARKVAAATGGAGADFAGSSSPSGTALKELREDDEGSLTPEECFDESDAEEVSEEEYSDSYEDDFDPEDEDSEGVPETDVEELLAPHHAAAGADPRSREEQDYARVMANYEQDISRTRIHAGGDRGHSPTRRSAAPAPQPSPPAAASGGGGPPGQIMDIKARSRKLREELIAKMGAETFQTSYDYLSKARANGTDQKIVKKELEALLGREGYKQFGFDVDQLVFASSRHP